MTRTPQADCIFCKILTGELPSTRVAEGVDCVAIEDRFPQAPVHCLVIPKVHIASLEGAVASDAGVLAEMLLLCQTVARRKGIDASGYRVLTNVGVDGGQAIAHLHLHVLGGRKLGAKLVAGG